MRFGERLVGKIPFVRSIYQAIKRIADSLFMDKARSFKKVVMVEYPRRGIYSVGFITGTPNGEIQKILGYPLRRRLHPARADADDGFLRHGAPG